MNKQTNFFRNWMESIDRRFLLNKPVFWSTRLLRVLILAPLVYLLLAIFSYFGALDPRGGTNVPTWTGFYIVISILFFVWWMIYLLRFNVFKRFGQWKPIDSLIHFLCYFLIIGLIVFLPFVPILTESYRANRAYTSAELVNDANAINRAICLLEKDSINLKFSYDTIQLSSTIRGSVRKDEYVEDYAEDVYSSRYFVMDSTEYNNRFNFSDSMLVLNDSMFIDFEYPDYAFLSLYERSFNDIVVLDTWDKIELFKRFLARPVSFDPAKERETLFARLKKYDPRHPGTSVTLESGDYYTKGWQVRIKERLGIDRPNDAMNNILEKKYRLSPMFWDFSLRLLGYFSLILSLLVFYYRHNTRPAFFLSLLTGVILAIITGLIVASARGGSEIFITFLVVYFVLFSILAFITIHSRKRMTLSAISLNLAVTILPFIPLLIVALYYNSLHEEYDRIYSYIQDSEQYLKMFGNEGLHYMLAEGSGFILLLILIPVVIGGLYRRWYALPED